MPTILNANVITADGRRFAAPVANLTTTGLFLRTPEDLKFRQRLTVQMLGFSFAGEVLFISTAPPGVVVSLAVPQDARSLLDTRSKTVEILAGAPVEQPWEEHTAPEGSAGVSVDDLISEGALGASTDAVEPWKLEVPAPPQMQPPSAVAKDIPLDPLLFASASLDDSEDLPPSTIETSAIIEAPVDLDGSADVPPMVEASPINEAALELDLEIESPIEAPTEAPLLEDLIEDVIAPPPVVLAPPPPPPPPPVGLPRAVSGTGGLPAPRPRGSSGVNAAARSTSTPSAPSSPPAPAPRAPSLAPPPRPVSAPKAVTPVLPPFPGVIVPDPPALAPPPPPPVAAAPPPTKPEAPPEAPSPPKIEAPAPIDPTLPELEGDTVRFASQEHFHNQFRSNLMHGGLVVRGKALGIGTQRLLAIAVPGFEPYTVSARVVFHEPGKIGFMLDSFNLHKARLSTMADVGAQPSA